MWRTSSRGDFCLGWQQPSNPMAGGKRIKPPADEKKEKSGQWEGLPSSHTPGLDISLTI